MYLLSKASIRCLYLKSRSKNIDKQTAIGLEVYNQQVYM